MPVTLSRMISGRLPIALVALLGLCAVLSGCGASRPALDDWKALWEETVQIVPDESTLEDPPSEPACEEVLVSLRAIEDDVLPTPDEAIDGTVRLWLEVAKGAFFDCPPGGGFAPAYQELETLQAEVEAALESDSA